MGCSNTKAALGRDTSPTLDESSRGGGGGGGGGGSPASGGNGTPRFTRGLLEDDWIIDYNNPLGKGHYATVYAAIERMDEEHRVAVKCIKRAKSKQVRLDLEIEILRKVSTHPNIITLLECYETDEYVQLVMERVFGGELFDHIVAKGAYSEADAAFHVRKCVDALAFLHAKGIVHRDLKPENILLSSKDDAVAEVMLADFGLAKLLPERVTTRTVCGTWAYCAPEVKQLRLDYGPKVDVWSIGVILYILLVAYHPFDPMGDSTDAQMARRIRDCRWDFDDAAWDCISSAAKDLLRHMLERDQAKRFSATQCLAHEWLRDDECPGSPPHKPISPRIAEARSLSPVMFCLCFLRKHKAPQIASFSVFSVAHVLCLLMFSKT